MSNDYYGRKPGLGALVEDIFDGLAPLYGGAGVLATLVALGMVGLPWSARFYAASRDAEQSSQVQTEAMQEGESPSFDSSDEPPRLCPHASQRAIADQLRCRGR